MILSKEIYVRSYKLTPLICNLVTPQEALEDTLYIRAYEEIEYREVAPEERFNTIFSLLEDSSLGSTVVALKAKRYPIIYVGYGYISSNNNLAAILYNNGNVLVKTAPLEDILHAESNRQKTLIIAKLDRRYTFYQVNSFISLVNIFGLDVCSDRISSRISDIAINSLKNKLLGTNLPIPDYPTIEEPVIEEPVEFVDIPTPEYSSDFLNMAGGTNVTA